MSDIREATEPAARQGETQAQRIRPRQSYLSALLREVGINIKEELQTLITDAVQGYMEEEICGRSDTAPT